MLSYGISPVRRLHCALRIRLKTVQSMMLQIAPALFARHRMQGTRFAKLDKGVILLIPTFLSGVLAGCPKNPILSTRMRAMSGVPLLVVIGG